MAICMHQPTLGRQQNFLELDMEQPDFDDGAWGLEACLHSRGAKSAEETAVCPLESHLRDKARRSSMPHILPQRMMVAKCLNMNQDFGFRPGDEILDHQVFVPPQMDKQYLPFAKQKLDDIPNVLPKRRMDAPVAWDEDDLVLPKLRRHYEPFFSEMQADDEFIPNLMPRRNKDEKDEEDEDDLSPPTTASRDYRNFFAAARAAADEASELKDCEGEHKTVVNQDDFEEEEDFASHEAVQEWLTQLPCQPQLASADGDLFGAEAESQEWNERLEQLFFELECIE